MNSILKKILCLGLAVSMMTAFAGCKKSPAATDSELSDEIEYVYIDAPSNEDGGEDNKGDTESDSSKNNTSGNKNNSSSNKNNTSGNKNNSSNKNNGNTNKPVTSTVDDKDRGEIDKGRIKDLKGREIVYVATWDATDRNSENGKKIKEVELLLNCKFVERKMSDYKALYTSILSGAPIADLFYPKAEQPALNLAKKGYLIPLDTLSNFNLKADCWDKACIAENTLNGHVYAISNNAQVRSVLMYNKTMFQKNNWEDLYTLQKNGKLTWAKLTEIMGKAAQVSGSNVNRYGLVPTYSIQEFGRQMLWANGAKVLTRQGDSTNFKYTLENKNATNALNQLREWVSNKGYLYDSSNFGWDTGRKIFASGKAAMAIVDYNQFGAVYNNADFDIGMCLFPHGPDSKNDLVESLVSSTAIPKGVKAPNDVALFWDILGEYRNSSVLNVGQSLYDAMPDPSVKATITKYLENTQSGKYVYDYGYYMSTVTDNIKKVAYGETTAAAALSSISQEINAQIQDFWK